MQTLHIYYGGIDKRPYDFVTLVDLKDNMISAIPTQYFTGTAVTPALVINDGTRDLVLGTDYTVSYTNNDKVGTATVTITGLNQYLGTLSKTFAIEVKEEKSSESVEVGNPKTFDGILLYIGLGLISIVGLTSTGLYIKKRFN